MTLQLVGADTESYPDGSMLSLSASTSRGSGFTMAAGVCIPMESLEAAFHNALWDMPVLIRAGYPLPAICHDTYLMLKLLQADSLGLKANARRELGMVMRDYMDVVGPYQRKASLDYLRQALEVARLLPPPIPQLIRESLPDGSGITTKLYKPTPLSRVGKPKRKADPAPDTGKIARLLKDIEDGKLDKEGNPPDALKRWKEWGEGGDGQTEAVEAVIGPHPVASLADVPDPERMVYECQDSDAGLRLFHVLKPRLQSAGLWDAYLLDIASFPMVAEMEANGIMVDRPRLLRLIDRLEVRLADVETDCWEMAGYPFNPQSSDQVAHLLYRKMGLKPRRFTEGGSEGTQDDDILPYRLEYPIVSKIIEYRRLLKLKCLGPETRVLKSDLTWVRIDSLTVGDELVGIDEHKTSTKEYRKVKRSTVEAVERVRLPSKRIWFSNGSVVTASYEHPWLAAKMNSPGSKLMHSNYRWVTTDKLVVGNKINSLCVPWEPIDKSDTWLAGIADGEGSMNKHRGHLDIAQKWGDVLSRAYMALVNDGFHPGIREGDNGTGGKVWHISLSRREEVIKFFGQYRPTRLDGSLSWEGWSAPRNAGGTVRVLAIEDVGEQDLIGIKTSTATFVAEGLFTHNTTYAEPYARLSAGDGRVRCRYGLSQTIRFQGREPNLSAIPAHMGVVPVPEAAELHNCFIPSPGMVFLAWDAAQIEMRVTAHHSQDEEMIRCFWADEDIHTTTAMEVFGLTEAEVLADEDKYRYPMKRTGFGIVYGLTGSGLYRQMEYEMPGRWTEQQCFQFIENYLDKRPGVRQYMADTIAAGRRTGEVRDLVGHRLLCPALRSPNDKMKQDEERRVINFPIQAGAVSLVKAGMAQVYQALQPLSSTGSLRWLLQEHDAIKCEVEEGWADVVKPWVKELLEGAMELRVPVKASSQMGMTLGELH